MSIEADDFSKIFLLRLVAIHAMLNQTIEDSHMQHVTLSGAKGLAV
jgi:hypothetical protein